MAFYSLQAELLAKISCGVLSIKKNAMARPMFCQWHQKWQQCLDLHERTCYGDRQHQPMVFHHYFDRKTNFQQVYDKCVSNGLLIMWICETVIQLVWQLLCGSIDTSIELIFYVHILVYRKLPTKLGKDPNSLHNNCHQGLICTVRLHFIVAWLNGESRYINIKKLILILVFIYYTHYTV